MKKKFIEIAFTKKGEPNKYHALLKMAVEGRPLHLKKWTRSGSRYSLVENHYNNLVFALEKIGIEFTTGNDAPRQGAEGDFIILTKKGVRQLKKLMS